MSCRRAPIITLPARVAAAVFGSAWLFKLRLDSILIGQLGQVDSVSSKSIGARAYHCGVLRILDDRAALGQRGHARRCKWCMIRYA
jgi:hypothetical protein